MMSRNETTQKPATILISIVLKYSRSALYVAKKNIANNAK